MDFKTGIAEIEAASYDEPPPRNFAEKIWAWLVSDQSLWQPCELDANATSADVIT